MNEELILKLLKERNYSELKQILKETNSVDLAESFKELDPKSALLLFRMLPKDNSAEVFSFLDIDEQIEIVQAAEDEEVKEIVQEMFLDDMVDLVEELPANLVNKILIYTDKDKRDLVNQYLQYPKDSAGALMTIEYVSLKKDMTIKQALDHIKAIGMSSETVYTCYVLDDSRKLLGIASLRSLVISDEDLLVEDVMVSNMVYGFTDEDQEELADKFNKYGFIAIPIVDHENRMTGIVTVDDILKVMEMEATEDFQLLAAMTPDEEEYIGESVWELTKHRFPWLIVLMLSATIAARIIETYEAALLAMPILTLFMPMIMDTGGNAGTQSSTLIIRGLATGEIKSNQALKIFKKETMISLLTGGVLGVINFGKLMLIDGASSAEALVISITIAAVLLMANLIGGLLPILAEKLKIDPALMAGPIITTVVDAGGLIVYFKIATMLLG